MDRYERDKMLTRQIYEILTSILTSPENEEYQKREEYQKQLEIISQEYKLTVKYLNELLDDFYKLKATSEEKMKIREAKKRNTITYKQIVEKLISLNEEEIKKYIAEQKLTITKIKISFKKYIEQSTGKNINQIVATYEYIIRVYEQNKNGQKIKQDEEDYQNAINLFEQITKEGFFLISDFYNQRFRDNNMSEEECKSFVYKHLRILKYKYPEKYNYYLKKMNENRLRAYLKLKDKIEEMLAKLPDNYDIVDYYVNINMRIYPFKNLCEKFLKQEDKTKISKFISKYSEEKYPYLPITQYQTITLKKGTIEELSEEIINLILEFMQQYNIPNNYFYICYKKYTKGELDKYMDIPVKVRK